MPPEGRRGMQPLFRCLDALTRACHFAAWKWDSSEYHLLDVILTNERNEHMTSARKAEANRQNALKSTGPKTPAGKAAVRLNALTRGLLSEEILLPGEDEVALRELAESLRTELQPVGELETLLVGRVTSPLEAPAPGEGRGRHFCLGALRRAGRAGGAGGSRLRKSSH